MVWARVAVAVGEGVDVQNSVGLISKTGDGLKMQVMV